MALPVGKGLWPSPSIGPQVEAPANAERAEVAELADALHSGCSARQGVEVRVLSSAPGLIEPRASMDLSFAAVSETDTPSQIPHPMEMAFLGAGASPRRRREFALGRTAARVALEHLSGKPQPVLRGRRGEPLWPEGVIGSVAHCRADSGSWAIALVARCSLARAIGVDLERMGTVRVKEVADVICCRSELAWAAGDGDWSDRLTMLFSAKESVFKAFYPICRRFFDFSKVMLIWAPESERFRGRSLAGLGPELERGHEFDVGCSRVGAFVVTFVVEPAARQIASLTDDVRVLIQYESHRLTEAGGVRYPLPLSARAGYDSSRRLHEAG